MKVVNSSKVMRIVFNSCRSFIKSDLFHMKITKFTTTQCIIALALFCGLIMCCSCKDSTQEDLMLNAYKTRVQQLERNNELLLDYYQATNVMLDSISEYYPIDDTYFETDDAQNWLELNRKIGDIHLKERGYR